MEGLQNAIERMNRAGVPQQAIDVFESFYHQLEDGATGLIPESDVLPLTDVDRVADLDFDLDAQRDAARRTVIIKLNGGLGTSMGMECAKSLLEVRAGESFLDIIVEQVRHARADLDVQIPLMFMNSFRTNDDTRAALAKYDDLLVPGIPLDFMQNQEPKLRVEDLSPIDWPADPSLEWCPPGHADIYTALTASGVLDTLLEAGIEFASFSNADNLGANPDSRMMAWFAASGAPYAAEVCRRTKADVKGGHVVVRREDGRLLLRETGQVPSEDQAVASDLEIHKYFHTNNLWINLRALKETLAARDGVMGLPLIRNEKNVDPTDPTSPRVIQIESAMGAAIGVFEGATTIEVPRARFLPVKTTNDLLLMRSDVYEIGSDHVVRQIADIVPLIDLDRGYFTTIADFEARVLGLVSLQGAQSLTVRGDWTLSDGVVVEGQAVLEASEPSVVSTGETVKGPSRA